MHPRLLLLDRDGVINEDSPAFIKDAHEWRPIPGSLAAIGQATLVGFRIYVVTNQSGLAHGKLDIEALHRIHTRMLREAAQHGGRIEAVLFCPHAPRDDCNCRKPKTGLLQTIERRSGLQLGNAVLVGDRSSDLGAANKVGAQAILVRTGHGTDTAKMLNDNDVALIVDDLAAAVAHLAHDAS